MSEYEQLRSVIDRRADISLTICSNQPGILERGLSYNYLAREIQRSPNDFICEAHTNAPCWKPLENEKKVVHCRKAKKKRCRSHQAVISRISF